ncbi:MAG TPA: hypothetical protein VG407_15955 [Caulobacteraceae bacterium]|jgi:hypothetical protein|nr:hypothetical protein [Caulobacteraceae bacterium]
MSRWVTLDRDVLKRTPGRTGKSLALLLFGTFGAPAAWGVQFVVNYAIAADSCGKQGAPLRLLPPGYGLEPIFLYIINVAAIVVAIVAWFVSRRFERSVPHDTPTGIDAILRIVEVRTLFLARAGLINSALFLAAILFDTVYLIGVPQCSG